MMEPTCGSSSVPRFQLSWSLSSATARAFSRVFLPRAVTSQRMRYISPHASPVSGTIPYRDRSSHEWIDFMITSISGHGRWPKEESLLTQHGLRGWRPVARCQRRLSKTRVKHHRHPMRDRRFEVWANESRSIPSTRGELSESQVNLRVLPPLNSVMGQMLDSPRMTMPSVPSNCW